MRVLKNPFKPLSEEEFVAVKQFITESRDPECARIIHNAFITGGDIDLSEIRYPLSRYVTKAFDVFVTKKHAINQLKRFKLEPPLNDNAIELICELHKRPPKEEYQALFNLVFNKGMTYTEALIELDNVILYPNIVRACQAFEEIVKLIVIENSKD
ncbi:hypothetical protein GCM10011607_11830 [Shewanella inventionis]|uniref:Uncharacterized protein n=1 Tax=Shewanella inventionis TaxID=1738770 RepID=A0ABQ1IY04_9GAMM|nr:hypothetical protein [Shewanella inventionis]GGB52968.1 hypothetical protein GCM10011607_11830 [Shewanella inventionis]